LTLPETILAHAVDPTRGRCGGFRSVRDWLSRDPGEEVLVSRVVHFEIHADDVERAKTFYNAVFDWSFR